MTIPGGKLNDETIVFYHLS